MSTAAAGQGPAVYRYGADPAQFGELWLPDGPAAGTAVVIHGGFWRARYDLSLGRPLAADLAARGYAAWNLEYRRAGAGGGWPGTFEDVAAGIDLLATLPTDTSRVVAIGHSAGGHLAAWAAGRANLPPGTPGANPVVGVTGVVAQAGVLALADCAREHVGGTAAVDLMGGGPDELPEEYRLADPVAAVPVSAPVLCLHSRADASVPYSYSERYVAAATAAGGRATLTETHGDHFTLIDPASPDWEAAVAALPTLFSRTLQPGTDLPQIGEGGAEQGGAQVRRARRAAGALLGADDPFDHLHVPVAPFLDTFVDVDEGLADLGRFARPLVYLSEQRLDLAVGRRGLARVPGERRGGDLKAGGGEEAEQRGEHRPPGHDLGERRLDDGPAEVAAAEHPLKVTELSGLEAA